MLGLKALTPNTLSVNDYSNIISAIDYYIMKSEL